METIRLNDVGAAVEDIQQRLVTIGCLAEDAISCTFDQATLEALHRFCEKVDCAPADEVDDRLWSALVDASFCLGDRTLYLRMPYFHGHDVRQLQQALGALGFACDQDGIFGAYTEQALRKFQLNMGLPADGIAGAYTYACIQNLHHSWEGKSPARHAVNTGFARAADVLESHALCLFGMDEFTRSVASRMSNLAIATNPASKMVSAESLLVKPDDSMLLVHIMLPETTCMEGVPLVSYDPDDSLALRLEGALGPARATTPPRIAVKLPGTVWYGAGEGRSAQHFAITLLDAFCSALSE